MPGASIQKLKWCFSFIYVIIPGFEDGNLNLAVLLAFLQSTTSISLQKFEVDAMYLPEIICKKNPVQDF